MSEIFKQGFCVLQIGRVKPLGEPPVHWRQQVGGVLALVLGLPQTSEAGGGAEFLGLCLLATGDGEGVVETGCSVGRIVNKTE